MHNIILHSSENQQMKYITHRMGETEKQNIEQTKQVTNNII